MLAAFTSFVRLFKPRRRWAQFSLGTMLLAVSALCVWLGLHMQAVNRQRTAIAALLELGGSCWYEHQVDERGDCVPDASGPWPDALKRWLGIDHLADVVDVRLGGTTSIPQAMPHLRALPKLKNLVVWLPEQSIADDDLQPLESLPFLRSLVVGAQSGRHISLACLGALPKLEVLEVFRGKLNSDDLEQVGRSVRLRRLSFSFIPIADGDVAHLAALERLAELRLEVAQLTDAGIAYLRPVKSLRRLNLLGNRITDAGIPHFCELHELREVILSPPGVTDTGVAELQKALPNCEVYCLPPPRSGLRW
jgi:hypothetical protein